LDGGHSSDLVLWGEVGVQEEDVVSRGGERVFGLRREGLAESVEGHDEADVEVMEVDDQVLAGVQVVAEDESLLFWKGGSLICSDRRGILLNQDRKGKPAPYNNKNGQGINSDEGGGERAVHGQTFPDFAGRPRISIHHHSELPHDKKDASATSVRSGDAGVDLAEWLEKSILKGVIRNPG
jgi:hypothetical protein